MAIVEGVIVETGQAIEVNLPTARTVELPQFVELADDDLFNAFDVDDNKSKKLTVAQLRDKINGSGTTNPPVINGADMEISIPDTLVGQKRIDIPALAGLTFWLDRIGYGRMWSSWFNTISTGGFELTRDEDQFWSGDKFVAHIYEYEGGNSSIPGNSGSGQSFVKGMIPVNADYLIKPADFYYVLNIQSGTNKPTITLPDIQDVEENAFIHFIAMINNTYKTAVRTTNGQYIYINGGAYQVVYIGLGETLRLYRGVDGWYSIDTVIGYKNCGQIAIGYSSGINTIPGNGQEIRRDSEPRLWQVVQTFGNSLISESQWQSSIDYQGCFSTGDGKDTFRLPNLRGTVPRFWDNGRGFDTNGRIHNYPGGYQPDDIKSHNHELPPDILYNGDKEGGISGSADWQSKGYNVTKDTGKNENTMKNTAVMGLICT